MQLKNMKDIAVGYFDLLEKIHVSAITIDKNFLRPLRYYANVTIIPVAKRGEIEDSFRDIEKYKLDYLYVDCHYLFLQSFLLREKLGIDIPFIIVLHTVYTYKDRYVQVIPLIRKYDIILAPSGYAKESFLRISDKFDVKVVPYFLDIKFIQKNISNNFNEHKKVITFMGRLIKEKGIGTLIKCMPKIISKVNNAHLNVIGPLSGQDITDYPKSPFVKKIEREIRRLKLTNRIHFKGVRFDLDKYKILSKSDIFINPTTAKVDTFGVTNIEALACGLPVIATQWAGNRELITDGRNGFLVNVNYDEDKTPKVDTVQLISFIVKVLKNKRLNLKLKKNAMETAQKFDYRKVIPKFIKLLKKRKKAKFRNRWELLKNKRITDFSHLFNRDFLFFLFFFSDLRGQTYASLYKRIIVKGFSESRYYSTTRSKGNKNTTDIIKIRDKILHNFIDFLLLRSD